MLSPYGEFYFMNVSINDNKDFIQISSRINGGFAIFIQEENIIQSLRINESTLILND